MTTHTDDVLLDVKTVARRCGVTSRTIYNRLDEGAFPKPVRIGRSTRWRRSDLDAFIEAGCCMSEYAKRRAAGGGQ